MNQLHARRNGPPIGAVRQTIGVANRQHHVRPAVDVQRRARGIAAARIDAQPQSQRVIFWEYTFPYQCRSHWQRQQLGQFFDLVSRTRRQSATADIENGESGLHQEISSALNVLGIRCRLTPWADGVIL